MKLLLTGFEPFAGFAANPTQRLVEEVERRPAPDVEVVPVLLPVTFDGALARVRAAIDEHEPDGVLSLGLAAGRTCVTPERIGVNVAHVEPSAAEGGHDRADNEGAAPRHARIVGDGQDALLATYAPDGAVAALRAAGVPAAVSESAGTYVCNTVLYGVLEHLRRTGREDVPAGFVHVPATPDLALADSSLPSMDPGLLRTGLSVLLQDLIDRVRPATRLD